MEREDYVDPRCPLSGKPGEEEILSPIPVGRVLEKLDEYEMMDDMAGAERHLLYWLAEAEQGRDLRGQLTLCNELMGIYRMSGKGEQAKQYSGKALALVERLGMEETITAGTTFLNSGTVRVACGEPEEGILYFEKARVNYEHNLPPEDSRLGGLYNNMGLCLISLERYEEAEDVFRQALKVMSRQPGGELEQAITWLNLADMAEAKLGPEAAEPIISEYLETAMSLLNTESLPRNEYYSYVCDKCAPVFGRYGFFLDEAELQKRVRAIREEIQRNV